MSIPVTYNGLSLLVPVTGDLNWGSYTTQLLYTLATNAPSINSETTFNSYIIIANTGGLVLQSPNGTYFSITVDNNGVLATTPVTLP
jgi:hypothetical protein